MDTRDRQNLAVALAVVGLLLAGYWVVTAMHRHKIVEECLLQRRHDCDRLLER